MLQAVMYGLCMKTPMAAHLLPSVWLLGLAMSSLLVQSVSEIVKLTDGHCPVDRQVSKEECLSAAKLVGAQQDKTSLDGGNDAGMSGRPQGCTIHEQGNVEWWGPSNNAACGSMNYNCVCRTVSETIPGCPKLMASNNVCFTDTVHNAYAGANCFMDQDHLTSGGSCCSSPGVAMIAFFMKDSNCKGRRLDFQEDASQEVMPVETARATERHLRGETTFCSSDVLPACYVGRNFFNNHHRAQLKHGSSICLEKGVRQAILFQKDSRCPS